MTMVQSPRIAVIGGGITGTLASLVLKNRGLSPLLIDSGKSGLGGRLRGSSRTKIGGKGNLNLDAGSQFFRASDPKLIGVMQMLERSGMLSKWKGRFGLLGSQGGGFLPTSIVRDTAVTKMGRDDKEETSTKNGKGRSPTDTGDFCGFVQNSTVSTYVGMPTNADLCPAICSIAGIDVLLDTHVVKADVISKGGWKLEVENNGLTSPNDLTFDALVMATHDPSFVASTVRSIIKSEASISSESDETSSTIQSRLGNLVDDLQAVRDNGPLPLFTWTGRFSSDFSKTIPFDAVSVPGSNKIQFLAREASKVQRIIHQSNECDGEIWTAVSTSAFAADVLMRLGSTKEASEEASNVLSEEVSNLLSAAMATDAMSPASTLNIEAPQDVSAVRWGSAFSSKTLGLKEDSITLTPWRVAIGGDYIREDSGHQTPFEAAALSGLEAGERVAALFQTK